MILIILVLSYLIGSIPFALIIGKRFYKVDIRQHGSGNLGGTNSFRVLGKKAGIAVTSGDILKGTLAASLPFLLGIEMNYILAGIPAIIGHSYPIFANFKGGKAVATTAGVLAFSSPISFLIAFVVFFITLKLTKYVSLSSMIAITSVFIFSLTQTDRILITLSVLMTLFIIFKHKANIKRIIEKTEPKVKWI